MSINENELVEGFGKHYSRMYKGSMIGAGSVVFAVMGYVIANQMPCPDGEMRVDLNPDLLGFILGDGAKAVSGAIDFLCSPDEKSRTKVEGGKRLVKEGEFSYRVVNGKLYREMGLGERRREQNRAAKQRERAKKKAVTSGTPLAGEAAYVKAEQAGANQEVLDGLSAPVSIPSATNEGPKVDMPEASERRHSIPTVEDVIGVGVAAGIAEADCREWHKDRALEGWADRNGCDIGNWRSYLLAFRDRKRVTPGNGSALKSPSVHELRTVMEAKQRMCEQSKMRHATEDGLQTKWDDEEARVEYVRLKGEIKELNAQIAGRA